MTAELNTILHRLDARQVRLFACACAYAVWDILTDTRSRNAVEVAERFADGQATEQKLTGAYVDAPLDSLDRYNAVGCDIAWIAVNNPPESKQWLSWWQSFGGDPLPLARSIAGPACERCEGAGEVDAPDSASGRTTPQWVTDCKACDGTGRCWPTVCGLQRKPFCNQFAHVNEAGSFWLEGECPCCGQILAWRDGTVSRLACTIYDNRDWGLLPMLADALEEAGASKPFVLAARGKEEVKCERCKGTGSHDAPDPASGRVTGEWTTDCKVCQRGRTTRPLPCVKGSWWLDALRRN